LLIENQNVPVVLTGCRENYPAFREHSPYRRSPGVLNPSRTSTPPPPKHEGRYASLHEVKLRDIPEVYKLSDVANSKFNSKMLSDENSVIRSFRICLLHEIFLGSNKRE
jgi:hypothetical protein